MNVLRSRVLTMAAVAVALLLLARDGGASQESIRDIVKRAGAWVAACGDALASVVADEEYLQELVAVEGGAVIERRLLRSEIAFVHVARGEWLAFRNVVAVDGEPAPDSKGRLERIFRAGGSLVSRAQSIADDSARYNLGPVLRNINAPTMPLQFLHPSRQEAVRFEDGKMDGDMRVVRFRDRGRGTLIRSPEGRDVPVEGRFWIAPADGRVMRASFVARNLMPRPRRRGQDSRAILEVVWRHDPKLDLWVPATMHERYEGPWRAEHTPYTIVGAATYTNYRRFDVDVRLIDRK